MKYDQLQKYLKEVQSNKPTWYFLGLQSFAELYSSIQLHHVITYKCDDMSLKNVSMKAHQEKPESLEYNNQVTEQNNPCSASKKIQ